MAHLPIDRTVIEEFWRLQVRNLLVSIVWVFNYPLLSGLSTIAKPDCQKALPMSAVSAFWCVIFYSRISKRAGSIMSLLHAETDYFALGDPDQ